MKGDLSEPQRLIMADTVTKNSKTGITANKRLLVIKKGYLFYYSNVPKNFKNDIKFLQSYQQLPKCSIEILNIKKINGFQQNSNYFSIQFEARHMMQREDIRKTMTLQQFNFAPKNKKQTITWQFTCDNQQIKQKWVHTLQTLHAHYSKEKINIQKFFDNINKKDDEHSAKPAIRSSLMVPWREDQIKKSSSNESLTKIRGSQISNNVSPSQNSKKSPNSNSEKNSSNSPNELKLISSQHPPEQQDIVESFMKIEKTKSLYEPVTNSIRQQAQVSVIETPSVAKSIEFGSNDHQFMQTPEANQKGDQSPKIMTSFTKKMQIEQVTEELPKQPSHKELPKQQSKKALPKQQSNKALPKQSSATEFPIKRQTNAQILISQQRQNSNKNSTQKFQPLFQPIPIPDQSATLIPIPKFTSKPTSHSPHKKISSLSQPPFIKNLSLSSQSIQFNVDSNTNFYQLIYFSSNRQYAFEKRIQAQKRLNAMIGSFNEKSVKNYIQFVHEKVNQSRGQGKGNGRFVEENIAELVSIVEIGLFKYKIGYVNTQAVTINGKQKVFYNQSVVKSIKKQLKIYNKLLTLINANLKTSLSSPQPKSSLQLSLSLSLSRSQASTPQSLTSSRVNTHSSLPSRISVLLQKLRVPLCTYMQYKGISTIVYDNSKLKNKQQLVSDKDKINELRQVMKILGFNGECFQFWRIDTAVGQIMISYIVSTHQIELKKENKHHNVNFSSPLNTQFLHQAKKDNASTSTQSLLNYIKKMQSIKQLQIFTTPCQQIQLTLRYCYLCKYLRKFYRAGQGQIDQLNFINLILKGDQNIQKLINSSGFQTLHRQNTKSNQNVSDFKCGVLGVFFQFFAYYLGICCVVDIELSSKVGRLRAIGVGDDEGSGKDRCVREVKLVPRVIGYSLQPFQLYQMFSKTQQYLSQNQIALAETCLQYKQLVYFDNPYQPHSHPQPPSCPLLLSQSQLSYLQNDYITCISKCKQFIHTIQSSTQLQIPQSSISQSGSSFFSSSTRNLLRSQCIPIYLLLIKCYSKFSKEKFNQSLKQAMTCAIDNFGEYSSVVVMFFQFVGLVFVGNGEYGQAEGYIRAAINVGVKVYKDISQVRVAQLYLELSRVLMYLGRLQQSTQYFTTAQQIIQTQGTPTQTTNLLLFHLESHIKSSNPDNIPSQQTILQLLHKLSLQFQQSQYSLSTIKQFYTLMYQAGIKYKKRQIWEKAVNQLWKYDVSCKLCAIQFVYRAIGGKFQGVNGGGWREVLGKWTVSKEKSMLVVEKGLGSYKNIVEMVEEVFAQEDPQMFPAIVKLLPTQIFKSF